MRVDGKTANGTRLAPNWIGKTSDSLALFPRLRTRANMAKEFPEFAETKAIACNLEGDGCSFVEGLGQSTKALDVVIRELARSEVPVLLLAEAGAGKKRRPNGFTRCPRTRQSLSGLFLVRM